MAINPPASNYKPHNKAWRQGPWGLGPIQQLSLHPPHPSSACPPAAAAGFTPGQGSRDRASRTVPSFDLLPPLLPLTLPALQAHLVKDPVTGRPTSHAVLWMESEQRARDLAQVGACHLCGGRALGGLLGRRLEGRGGVQIPSSLQSNQPPCLSRSAPANDAAPAPPPAYPTLPHPAPPPARLCPRPNSNCKRWCMCSTARRAPWPPPWRCQVSRGLSSLFEVVWGHV